MQLGQKIKAAVVIQIRVEQDDVGLFTGSDVKRVGGISGLADYLQSMAVLDQHTQH